jgi:hypothetical protein
LQLFYFYMSPKALVSRKLMQILIFTTLVDLEKVKFSSEKH